MLLSEQHIIKQNNQYYKELLDLCHKSKNLYNATLYTIRQYYFNTGKYLNYLNTYNQFKLEHNIDFYSLPSCVAQQTMRIVDQNFKSFFNLLKKKQQGLYNQQIKIPKYKNKGGYFQIIYTNDRFGKNYKKLNYVILQGTKIKLENIKNLNTWKQIRFIPKNNYIMMYVIYEKSEVKLKENNNRYLSIDLGINNLCSCVTNCKLNSFIIDGKKIKHINQYFNKCKALLQSKLNKNQYTSKLINNKIKKRNNQIKYYLHNVSKYLINHAVSNDINTIIIGKNNLWKQEINIGHVNNQNFVQIPFNQLINMIYYKAKLQGINVVTQEESYTSKVSFFDNDYIPVYGVDDKLFKPSGKRLKRGLFITSKGLRLNADVNGSLNIMKKYLKCNSDEILSPADVGFVVNPVKVKF